MQEDDQPEKASKDADDAPIEESETHSLPKMEPPYRFKLGASQKKRSKLVQQVDEVPAAAPDAAPAPEAPKADAPTPPKRVRLKRSGQMHEDLNGPLPDPPKRDEQY